MERMTVFLTARQKRALERAARATEPTLPLFNSGDATIAERVDELLAGCGER
jgi:hypothetical protein